MDSHTVNKHAAAKGARNTLEVFGAVGAALIAYLAIGVLLEAFTGIDVPFIAW